MEASRASCISSGDVDHLVLRRARKRSSGSVRVAEQLAPPRHENHHHSDSGFPRCVPLPANADSTPDGSVRSPWGRGPEVCVVPGNIGRQQRSRRLSPESFRWQSRSLSV
jgi:hypothetical protein